MKTINGVFDRIVSVENIEDAIREAAKGKRHKRAVRYALKHSREVAEELHTQLVGGTWTPPEYHNAHEIGDGISSKKRFIVCPQFKREQVVHHAILRVISPYIQKRFDKWSCGSIPGRGQEYLAKMLLKKMRTRPKEFKYFVKQDVHKFFESVDTEALKAELRRYLRDKRALRLIDMIIDANAVKMPDGSIRRRGIPIGFFTSPWFANIVLDRVDKVYREAKIHIFGRFMDDFVALSPNARKLKKATEEARNVLSRFGLTLKYEIQIHRFGANWANGIRITSFAICKGGLIKLRDRIFLKARRKGAAIRRKIKSGERVTSRDAGAIISYSGKFAAFGAYKAFVNEVLGNGAIKFASLRRLISRKAKYQVKEAA